MVIIDNIIIIYDLENRKQSQISSEDIMKVLHVHVDTDTLITATFAMNIVQGICTSHPRFVRLPGSSVGDIPVPDDKNIMVTITSDWILGTHSFPSEARKRAVDRVLGDGNCLFRALDWSPRPSHGSKEDDCPM